MYKEENRRMMNLLNELQPLGETQRPLAELYIQEKEMLAPGVNKVLAADIEAWKNLSDAELVSRIGELNELTMDGMFVADPMKLKHLNGERIIRGLELVERTMKHDSVGHQQEEYSYKSSVLRALAERAKTFAILVKAQINGGLDLSDITQSERGHV